jgi:hypothetical protein
MISLEMMDPCPKCGKQIQPEDSLTSNDDGIFYHIDCDNPSMKLFLNLKR